MRPATIDEVKDPGEPAEGDSQSLSGLRAWQTSYRGRLYAISGIYRVKVRT